MKKFFVFIVGLFVVGTVFAVGENIPTSKTYVDNAVAQKQNTISANNGNAQVLTNTGTAGTIGTKNIYDSSAAYETQTNSLVTAGTMNAAVQNAIDSEFVCIEYDANNECLLLEIRSAPQQSALPSGYTQLEYLESTGTQIIDTAYNVPPDFLRISGKFEITSFSVNGFLLFGNYNGYNAVSITGYKPTANYEPIIADDVYVIEAGTSIYPISQQTILNPNTVYYFDLTADSGLLTGNFAGDSINRNYSGNLDGTYSFCFYGSTNYSYYGMTSMRYYYFNIYNRNGLVRNFVPARRDSDGELGMYDTITNTFFTNAGTGEFIAGPVFSYLPQDN